MDNNFLWGRGEIGIHACLRSMWACPVRVRVSPSPLNKKTKVKEILVNKIINDRIDKFLMQEVFLNLAVTRGEIIRNIKRGNVLVNGKKVKPSCILKEGDKISIKCKAKSEKLLANNKIKFDIIHKDANIIVVDKPAGLKVHPSNFDERDTLVNGLLNIFPEIKNVSDETAGSELRPGIVHRLDKDTSGVMVVARNQKVFDELKKMFYQRKVSKKYLVLVYGILENNSGVIEKPIAKAANYKKQIIAGARTKNKIRAAITEYKVIKKFRDYSLVEVKPRTGRTHQIRVHLASIGHPVVGDKLYKLKSKPCSPAGRNENIKNIERQLLHAKELEFNLWSHKYAFQAELPNDFNAVLDSLTEGAEKVSIKGLKF